MSTCNKIHNFLFSEEEVLPGRPTPQECHAELHTDYDGAAVRWGLTHHKNSAADCCQACLDHAKRAKPGEMKCNIWVYCPSETGCFSPNIYEHKHTECWLKFVSFIFHPNRSLHFLFRFLGIKQTFGLVKLRKSTFQCLKVGQRLVS